LKDFRLFSKSHWPFLLRAVSAGIQFTAPFILVWLYKDSNPTEVLSEYVFLITAISISTAMSSFTLARIDSLVQNSEDLKVIPQVMPLVVVLLICGLFDYEFQLWLAAVVFLQNLKESIAYKLRKSERKAAAALIRDFSQKITLLFLVFVSIFFWRTLGRENVLLLFAISYGLSFIFDVVYLRLNAPTASGEISVSSNARTRFAVLADDVAGRLNAAWLALPVFVVTTGNSGAADHVIWLFLSAERAFRIFGLIVGQVSLETQYLVAMSGSGKSSRSQAVGFLHQLKEFRFYIVGGLGASFVLFVGISLLELDIKQLSEDIFIGIACSVFFTIAILANLLNANAFLRSGWRQVAEKFLGAALPLLLFFVVLRDKVEIASLPWLFVLVLLPDLGYLLRLSISKGREMLRKSWLR
jgi:hypothetical protein